MTNVLEAFLAEHMLFERTFLGKGFLQIGLSIFAVWIGFQLVVKLRYKTRTSRVENNLRHFERVFVGELVPVGISMQVAILALWFYLHAPSEVELDALEVLTYLGGLVTMFVLFYNDGGRTPVKKLRALALGLLLFFVAVDNIDPSGALFIDWGDELMLDVYATLYPFYMCLTHKNSN